MANDQSTLLGLIEVLRSEQRQHWLLGERILSETYFDRYPSLLDDADCALQLVYNEVVLREEGGETPRLEEYLQRFPRFAAQLPPLFEVHRALESDQLHLGSDTLHLVGADLPANGFGNTGPWPAVPGYEILGVLGRGGMGVVYQARHLRLNRLVALKMILAGNLAGPGHHARFRAEAEAVARLQHPNIVQIYEVGELNGLPYFSLEYVSGGTLTHVLNGTPQPARAAANLVRILALAVEYAHQRGILHRDLKPANILLANGEGEPSQHDSTSEPLRLPLASYLPKITDFGLAKQRDADVGHTGSGDVLGTPSYMAPEQAEGKVRQIGPTADVYALGAILYELLTGRPPFKARTPLDTLRQVIFENPVPISRAQHAVPRDLETICLKCLQKEPHKRYASARALAEDLQRFLADQSILARRSSSLERGWRWCRRNPAVAALVSSVVILLLIIAIGASMAAVRLRRELGRSEQAEQATVDQLWESKLEAARVLRQSSEAGRRFKALEVLRSAAAITPDLRLRNEAIACMALTDLGNARLLDGHAPPNGGIAFDSRLEHYALGDDRGNISIRRVADNEEISALPGEGVSAPILRFSPDGRFLAAKYYVGFGDQAKEYRVWDWRHRKPIVQQDSNTVGSSLDFTPDGQTIALGGRSDGTISFYNLGSGKEQKRLKLGHVSNDLAFHPSGRQLAASGRRVHVYDVESEAVVATFEASEDWFQGLAWRPDGRLLAGASAKGRVYVWNMLSGRLRAQLNGHHRPVIGVAFNHAGDLLASSSWDMTTRLWDPDTGEELVKAHGTFACFSHDDRHLAYIRHARGKQPGLWEVSRPLCRKLQGHQAGGPGPFGLAFTADGRALVSSSWDGIRIWDTATAREAARPFLRRTYNVLFDPGGQHLVGSCPAGVYQWPIQATKVPGNTGLRLGLPAVILPNSAGSLERACVDRSGKLLAVVDRAQERGIVVSQDKPDAPVVLGKHGHVASIGISPDGKWAATGTWKGVGVKIWDAATGGLVHSLPARNGGVAFSPDNRWLVVGDGDEYRFYHVGSWEAAHVVATPDTNADVDMAFTADSQLLAVNFTQQSIKLLRPVTGEDIATLVVAAPQDIVALAFSRDGGMLAAATRDQAIQLWDLRRVRRQLATLSLDWDLPPLPPPDDDKHLLTVDVEADAAFLAERGHHFLEAMEYGDAISEYRKCLEMEPGRIEVVNALAWAYVTAPMACRNAAAALPLAQKAVKAEPNNAAYLNTLGVVYYRLGRYAEAIAILTRNLEDHPGHQFASFDWIFLAMSHHKSGDAGQAHACYFRAIQLGAGAPQNQPTIEEFKRFRKEADALLAGGRNRR
jgi:serine/threonine protein kinase/WD40 repeat protein/Tfp pilus assembly protein PilF